MGKMSEGIERGPKLSEIAEALGVSRPRVTQLVAEGMPTDSIEAALAWRANRRISNQNAGHVAIPVRPINLGDLDSILNAVAGDGGGQQTEDKEMDTRIAQQVELCRITREAFVRAVQDGDPSQSKLYGNFDRAVATLMKMEKERQIRLQEKARLVDADEAAARYGKILSQLRILVERAELTVAPKANPDNPAKALIAFREFRDDLFRKISEYAPQVVKEDVNADLAAEVKPMEEEPKEEKGLEWEATEEETE
jgi:hypothetical protein